MCDKDAAEFMTLLVACNATVDLQSAAGFTPLYMACEQGHAECAQLLVAAKASVV